MLHFFSRRDYVRTRPGVTISLFLEQKMMYLVFNPIPDGLGFIYDPTVRKILIINILLAPETPLLVTLPRQYS